MSEPSPGGSKRDPISISSPKVKDTVKPTFTAIGTFLEMAGVTEVWCTLDGGAKVKATINSPRDTVWTVTFTTDPGEHRLTASRYISGTKDGSETVNPFYIRDTPEVTIENMGQGDTKGIGFRAEGTKPDTRRVTARLIPIKGFTAEPPQAVTNVFGGGWSCNLNASVAGFYEFEVTAADTADATNVVVTRIGELEIT